MRAEESFTIVGYEPSTAVPGALASLLLATEINRKHQYVGSVGTGFKRAEAIALRRQLDTIATSKPAIGLKGKNMVFVRPDLVAEIESRGWTDDAKLRHAPFKGLRDHADR